MISKWMKMLKQARKDTPLSVLIYFPVLFVTVGILTFLSTHSLLLAFASIALVGAFVATLVLALRQTLSDTSMLIACFFLIGTPLILATLVPLSTLLPLSIITPLVALAIARTPDPTRNLIRMTGVGFGVLLAASHSVLWLPVVAGIFFYLDHSYKKSVFKIDYWRIEGLEKLEDFSKLLKTANKQKLFIPNIPRRSSFAFTATTEQQKEMYYYGTSGGLITLRPDNDGSTEFMLAHDSLTEIVDMISLARALGAKSISITKGDLIERSIACKLASKLGMTVSKGQLTSDETDTLNDTTLWQHLSYWKYIPTALRLCETTVACADLIDKVVSHLSYRLITLSSPKDTSLNSVAQDSHPSNPIQQAPLSKPDLVSDGEPQKIPEAK